jgi:hypothetical protein
MLLPRAIPVVLGHFLNAPPRCVRRDIYIRFRKECVGRRSHACRTDKVMRYVIVFLLRVGLLGKMLLSNRRRWDFSLGFLPFCTTFGCRDLRSHLSHLRVARNGPSARGGSVITAAQPGQRCSLRARCAASSAASSLVLGELARRAQLRDCVLFFSNADASCASSWEGEGSGQSSGNLHSIFDDERVAGSSVALRASSLSC